MGGEISLATGGDIEAEEHWTCQCLKIQKTESWNSKSISPRMGQDGAEC